MMQGETTIYGIIKELSFKISPKKYFEISIIHNQDSILICSATDIELGKNLVDLLEKEVCIKGLAIWDSNLTIQAFFIKEISEFNGSFKDTIQLLKEMAGTSFDNVDVEKWLDDLRND